MCSRRPSSLWPSPPDARAVLLVGVQDHGVAVLRESLAGKLPRGSENLVWGRRLWHGKHDVVNKLRRPSRRGTVHLLPILSSGEFQVPIIEQALVLFPASDAFTVVSLDFQSSFAAQVREMSRYCTPPRPPAGHFHHDLRRMPDRAQDLVNLRGAESSGHLRTCAPVTHDLEESRPIGRQANESLSQRGPPKLRALPGRRHANVAPGRLRELESG